MTVFIELPGFFIDAVNFDELGIGAGAIYLEVINRSPEPDQEEIRADSLISFDVAGSLAAPPVLADTTVYIQTTTQDGVVGPLTCAYDGGGTGFQAGFNGALSAVSAIDPSTIRFVIDPTLDFDSLSTVAIFLETDSVSYPGGLAEDWSFVIEDVTAPRLIKAQGREAKTVRLTFDEPVNMESATASDSALTPTNYVFTRLEVPAVSIVASSVTAVSTSVVDVTLDIEMSPRKSYQVAVSNVADLLGNIIAAPFNSATFAGYTPAIPAERNFDLWRMLPRKNRDEDNGDLWNFISCLQEVTDLLLVEIDAWTDILDPDLAPEIFLDAMLQDLGNPFDFDLNETEKRKLIRILVAIYRQKGTSVGIINVIRFFLGIEIAIDAYSDEGWDLGIDELGDSLTDGTAILGPGTTYALYSFEIVSPIVLTAEQREQITNIANYMKPGHTHLIRIVEPTIPTVIDHLELGLSILGDGEWWLH